MPLTKKLLNAAGASAGPPSFNGANSGTVSGYQVKVEDVVNTGFLDESGALIETAGDWSEYYESSFTAPAGCTSVKIYLYHNGTVGAGDRAGFYWDNVQLYATTSPITAIITEQGPAQEPYERGPQFAIGEIEVKAAEVTTPQHGDTFTYDSKTWEIDPGEGVVYTDTYTRRIALRRREG